MPKPLALFANLDGVRQGHFGIRPMLGQPALNHDWPGSCRMPALGSVRMWSLLPGFFLPSFAEFFARNDSSLADPAEL